MRIGNREFDVENRTYVMGILNVTPDSFSDGGKWNSMDRALVHVEEMLAEGMDILDIGGESTRPGSDYSMSPQEELERVMPYIQAVKARFDVPLSLDTYKSQVAEAGIAAGVDLINDIWGLKWDEEMARVIGEHDVACCLMHNKKKAEYKDFISDGLDDLRESIRLAETAGIREDGICLDPGIGFGKTYEMNLEMMKYVSLMQELEYPILLGTSRKSMIGLTLDLPADQREEGTLVTTVMGVMSGCGFVRVHDVKANLRAIKMTEAILRVHGVEEM